MTTLRVAILAAAVMVSGCGDAAQSPTSPTTTTQTAILFTGTLQPRAARFYSYTLTTAGPVSAMLASLERGHTPTQNALELALGVPAGTGCAIQTATITSASLVPQLRQEATAGTYCVRIADVSGLPVEMNFTIRVMHP